MRKLVFILLQIYSAHIWACRVKYPDESSCASHTKIEVNDKRLLSLKRSVEKYYNLREKFILLREKGMLEKKKLSQSSCFNLRHAEMYINYVIQAREKNSKICADNIKLMMSSIESMIDSQSEENKFIFNFRQKITLVDQSVDVLSLLEAFKVENDLI